MASVWLVAGDSKFLELEASLKKKGIVVDRLTDDVFENAMSLYGARGLLLVDATHPSSDALVVSAQALVPVMLLGIPSSQNAHSAMHLKDVSDLEKATQHILDVLNERENQRRYPRAPVNLRVHIGDVIGRLRDISMYGVFLTPDFGHKIGQDVILSVHLNDGAEIRLDGVVVNCRDGGIAVRCRPQRDEDLLLWLHLLLGELTKNPRFADIDPFGPLFR